jgi:hypothetical protein
MTPASQQSHVLLQTRLFRRSVNFGNNGFLNQLSVETEFLGSSLFQTPEP